MPIHLVPAMNQGWAAPGMEGSMPRPTADRSRLPRDRVAARRRPHTGRDHVVAGGTSVGVAPPPRVGSVARTSGGGACHVRTGIGASAPCAPLSASSVYARQSASNAPSVPPRASEAVVAAPPGTAEVRPCGPAVCDWQALICGLRLVHQQTSCLSQPRIPGSGNVAVPLRPSFTEGSSSSSSSSRYS